MKRLGTCARIAVICAAAACVSAPAAASELAAVAADAGALVAEFSKAMAVSPSAPRYSTRCEIRDGVGYAFVTNHGSDRLRLRGRIYWYFYDEDGDEVGDERDRISERISRRDTTLVDEEDAPDDAASCAVDVSEAVEQEDDDEDASPYLASCQLEGGAGVGYITNRSDSSASFRGRVTFYFYNARGREIDSDRERISERIGRGDRERVGEVDAPDDAASCSLDITDALPD